jgi:hypothetical protein
VSTVIAALAISCQTSLVPIRIDDCCLTFIAVSFNFPGMSPGKAENGSNKSFSNSFANVSEKAVPLFYRDFLRQNDDYKIMRISAMAKDAQCHTPSFCKHDFVFLLMGGQFFLTAEVAAETLEMRTFIQGTLVG